jgi:hypothetical protein
MAHIWMKILVMARRMEGRDPIMSGCWVSTDWRIRSETWIVEGGDEVVLEERVRSSVTAVKAYMKAAFSLSFIFVSEVRTSVSVIIGLNG